MRKLFCISVMFAACLQAVSSARDDGKYLAGAVPETDGKVVFKKEYNLEGAAQDALYERVSEWLYRRMEANGNDSRVSYTNREEGQAVAQGEEYLVFSDKAFSLDRALMSYHLVALCKPGKCEMRIERIRYKYGDEKLTAEEQISDNAALNKKKTSLLHRNKKFRVHTVDFAAKLFDELGAALNVPFAPVPVPVPVLPATALAASGLPDALPGYKQLAPDRIPGNIIKMLNEDWTLITAGTDAQFNMMTASWGGLGVLYGKAVAICFINPARYTYQLMEKNETFTLTFYTEAYREALTYCGSNSGRDTDKVKGSGLTPITVPSGGKAFAEAWLIVECRKLAALPLSLDAIFDEKIKSEQAGRSLHKMYIGEILNVWIK